MSPAQNANRCKRRRFRERYMKNSIKRLAAEGMLLAASSVVFLIESLIPPLLPIAPYVKIGLANIFVMLIIVWYGAKEAFVFVLAKNLMTALVVPFAVIFNLAGSISSYLAMVGLYKAFGKKLSLVSISVAGAIMNNIARTAVAAVLMETPSLFVELPFVCGCGVAAGIIIGILVILCIKHLPEGLTIIK